MIDLYHPDVYNHRQLGRARYVPRIASRLNDLDRPAGTGGNVGVVAVLVSDISLTTAQAALLVSFIVGVFAIYGAVNSRRALEWQKQRDEERRQTRVRIDIEQWSSFGRDDGRPTAGMAVEELASLCQLWISVSIINDSEVATVYVRDIDVLGLESLEGQPLMSGDRDERLEPRQRLVRRLQIEEQDVEEYGQRGFVVRARLSTGELIEQADRLSPDMVLMPRFIVAAHERAARDGGSRFG